MRPRMSARKADDTNVGARRGHAYKGTPEAEGPSVVAVRRAAEEPVPEGHTKCPECGRVIRDRADGSMRMHRSQGVIPCIAAEPSLSGDVARRARGEK